MDEQKHWFRATRYGWGGMGSADHLAGLGCHRLTVCCVDTGETLSGPHNMFAHLVFVLARVLLLLSICYKKASQRDGALATTIDNRADQRAQGAGREIA